MAENANEQSSAAKETSASTETSGQEDSKVISTVLAEKPGYTKSLILRIAHVWPLKYVFQMLKKIAVFALPEEDSIGTAEQISPNKRRFLSGKKRIGRLGRLILLVTPHRLQYALGYRAGERIGKISDDELAKSPLKPEGKGSKRKQDDLDMEEQHSWVAFMTEDLPDEDQDDDPTYEPSESEVDSEENKSKNDTETDLEVEENEGVVMLKETTQVNEVATQGNEEPSNTSDGTEPNPDVEEKDSAPTSSCD
ncbi:uncharacterized protein ACNLHF_022166 isoform 2-T2 [Anomaloglossus baeobatrachus]